MFGKNKVNIWPSQTYSENLYPWFFSRNDILLLIWLGANHCLLVKLSNETTETLNLWDAFEEWNILSTMEQSCIQEKNGLKYHFKKWTRQTIKNTVMQPCKTSMPYDLQRQPVNVGPFKPFNISQTCEGWPVFPWRMGTEPGASDKPIAKQL